MNYNVPYYGFIRNFGIDEIYSVQPGRFTSTTILATRGAQKVTVSDVLKAAGYLNDFIKSNFDVTDTRYSETLLFLKTIKENLGAVACEILEKSDDGGKQK